MLGYSPSGIWLIPEMVMIGTEDGSETGDAQELVDLQNNNAKRSQDIL